MPNEDWIKFFLNHALNFIVMLSVARLTARKIINETFKEKRIDKTLRKMELLANLLEEDKADLKSENLDPETEKMILENHKKIEKAISDAIKIRE